MRYKKAFHRRSPYVYAEASANELSVRSKPSIRFILIAALALFLLFVLLFRYLLIQTAHRLLRF